MLAPFMVALASATLFVGIFALWQSFRATFGGAVAGEDLVTMPIDRRQIELQERLDAVLRTLKDIELEHDTGKIVDADYARMETELRARAKELLREREAGLGPYLDRARSRVNAYLARAGVTPTADAHDDAAAEPEPEPKATEAAAPECGACGVRNDADARFCKACGTSLPGAGAKEVSG